MRVCNRTVIECSVHYPTALIKENIQNGSNLLAEGPRTLEGVRAFIFIKETNIVLSV